jgi:acyl-CoA thioester hydrolase
MASTYTTQITAGPEHIDVLGHVNNAVWVQWMEQVATEHWTRDAVPEHLDAYVWVVTRHEIDYRGNVKEGETVTVRKVRVAAKSTWAIIDRESGRILRVPTEVAAPFLDA